MIPADMEPAKPLEARYTKSRSWQMSDHSLLWIEIDTDYSEHYLDRFVTDGAGGA